MTIKAQMCFPTNKRERNQTMLHWKVCGSNSVLCTRI